MDLLFPTLKPNSQNSLSLLKESQVIVISVNEAEWVETTGSESKLPNLPQIEGRPFNVSQIVLHMIKGGPKEKP